MASQPPHVHDAKNSDGHVSETLGHIPTENFTDHDGQKAGGENERNNGSQMPGIPTDGQGAEITQGLEGFIPLGLHQDVEFTQTQKYDQIDQQEEKQTSRTEETAEKLAEQFTAESGDVMNLLTGECEGDWACVRKALRDQEQEMSGEYSDKDLQTALQIGSKYGFLEEEVLAYHKESCGEDWACTRAYFRTLAAETKETGKPNKK